MQINGTQRNLVLQVAGVSGRIGIQATGRNGGVWLSDDGGYTTSLDFHGRVFATLAEAGAYLGLRSGFACRKLYRPSSHYSDPGAGPR